MTRDDCVLFTGHIMANGYGSKWSSVARIRTTAHRAAWMEKYGFIPRNVYVLHKCDVLYEPNDITYRRCINLEHLCVGTQTDNLRHMHRIGRGNQSRPGERHGMAKLTDADAVAIRAAHIPFRRGHTTTDLARIYGVCRDTISKVIRRVSWTHL